MYDVNKLKQNRNIVTIHKSCILGFHRSVIKTKNRNHSVN